MVELVKTLNAQGMTVQQACQTLEVPRSTYYAAQRARGEAAHSVEPPGDVALLERIRSLRDQHLFWGYRRITAWLRHREDIMVNRKRVLRLMRLHKLTLTQRPHKATRTPQRSKPRADRPRQIWGIDMTKFLVRGVGWCNLVIVLDWYTKKVVGHTVALRSRSQEWKAALNAAIEAEFPNGVRGSCLKLVSDNGSQPTSLAFIKECASLQIEQIFTSYDNPKGNAETERFMRTCKEELIWIEEFQSLEEAEQKLADWIGRDYNQLYVHSALGYLSPVEFEHAFNLQQLERAA